ncbi:MAG: guanylate kinase [Gemmatimonadetes bacterium]|nr:guanylate kinase [Gemmatimonadota bacterium]
MSGRASALVLVAPSGTGKTTVAHALVRTDPHYVFSVSATTRAPRGQERDGVDYHFLEEETFRARISRGELAEWAQVHGRLYGTPLENFAAARREGRTLVLDIDVQGALQVQAKVLDAVCVFLLPPSGRVLLERLRGRGTETEAETRARLRTALDELDQASGFRHLLVNEDVQDTVRVLRGWAESGPPSTAAAPELRDRVTEIAATLQGELAREGG